MYLIIKYCPEVKAVILLGKPQKFNTFSQFFFGHIATLKKKLEDYFKFFVAFLENMNFKTFDQNHSIVEILRSTYLGVGRHYATLETYKLNRYDVGRVLQLCKYIFVEPK
jgi:hypothetical protein